MTLKKHWILLIYLVLLMAGFNFMSHGSQDLYPTMLQNQYKFSANPVTVAQVVVNLGAITRGTVVGYCGQTFGRCFSIMSISVVRAVLLYSYAFTFDPRRSYSRPLRIFCVQGAWGLIPIHLMELSSGSFRTFVVGKSSRLGNLVSSASAAIEATIGGRFLLPSSVNTKTEKKTPRYEYGLLIYILMGCVYAKVVVLTFLGLEYLGCAPTHLMRWVLSG